MITAQEHVWSGRFGADYARRSPGNEEANYHLFKRILMGHNVQSAVELGCGTGANLRALKRMRPHLDLAGVEINADAIEALRQAQTPVDQLMRASLLEWEPSRTWDLAFTKGVLIHIHPDSLRRAYDVLYRAATHWLLVAEYYSPKPVAIEYRGQADLLWKRDFAGELLETYPDLRLVDYGFVYHRDARPQDDLTWFLMEKSQ